MPNSWDGRSPAGYGIAAGLTQGIAQGAENFNRNYLAGQASQRAAAEAAADRALKERMAQDQIAMHDRTLAQQRDLENQRQGMAAVKEGRPEAIPALYPPKPEDVAAAQQANVPIGMRNLETVGEMAGRPSPQLRAPELGRPTVTPSAGIPGFVTGAEGDTASYVPREPAMQLRAPEAPQPGRLEGYKPTPQVAAGAEDMMRGAEQTRQDLGKKLQFQAQEKMRLEGAKQGAITQRTLSAADIAGKYRVKAAGIAAAPANKRNQLTEQFNKEHRTDLANYAVENGLTLENGSPDIAAANAEVIKASKHEPMGGTPGDKTVMMLEKAKADLIGKGVGKVDMRQYGVPTEMTTQDAIKYFDQKIREAKGGGAAPSSSGGGSLSDEDFSKP